MALGAFSRQGTLPLRRLEAISGRCGCRADMNGRCLPHKRLSWPRTGRFAHEAIKPLPSHRRAVLNRENEVT